MIASNTKNNLLFLSMKDLELSYNRIEHETFLVCERRFK